MNKLMIIDDDRDIREMMVGIGESEGFLCQEASNGRDAFFCLRTFDADVLTLDLQMPHMDGNSFIEKIKKEYGNFHPKIIFISGYGKINGGNIGC